MKKEVQEYNDTQQAEDLLICNKLAVTIDNDLPEAESKIWHRHPVWFIHENPIVGYSKLKGGIRLMFWSGASFGEENLKMGTGKFKDASILYTKADEIILVDIRRWLDKAKQIQWDYKNVVKRKGKLIRLK